LPYERAQFRSVSRIRSGSPIAARRATSAFPRAIGRQAVRAGNGSAYGYFPPRAVNEKAIVDSRIARFASRDKIAAASPSFAAASALRYRIRVLVRSACRQVIATKAAMGAADLARDLTS
jgi:hypothetical protein